MPKVEKMDLYKEGTLYFVKKGNPQKLNYVIDQALNTLKLLKNNEFIIEENGVEMEVKLVTKFDWDAGYNGFLAGYSTQFDPDMAYVNFVTDASGNNMHYSNADVDKYLEEGRHGETEEARKEAYSEFEKAYAKAPGILLVAYLQGDYVGVSGLDGLDTTRVLGHHSVGVMWNIEDWTITK